ncbi:MAG: hypothetical protein FJ315_05860, partial [SAR202 cluster bacterium]|nr:hypothetical protein [SAR202 cluster bacterium]
MPKVPQLAQRARGSARRVRTESGPLMSAVFGGADLRRFCEASVAVLESNVEAINALNVYPVPDGDTGTNMML